MKRRYLHMEQADIKSSRPIHQVSIPRVQPRGVGLARKRQRIEQKYPRIPAVPTGSAGKLIPKCSVRYPCTFPYRASSSSSFSLPSTFHPREATRSLSIASCRLFRFQPRSEKRTWNLVDSRGEIPRRSNDYLYHRVSLQLSTYLHTHTHT